MQLNDVLRKRVIEKTVDPGGQRVTEEVSAAEKIKRNPVKTKLKITPLSVRVDDLIEFSNEVRTKADQVIADIVSANKGIPAFDTYFQLVKQAHVDPATFSFDSLTKGEPLTTLQNKPEEIAIKSAEREVFRTVSDPLAPFLRDILNFKAAAGSVKSSLENTWRLLTNPASVGLISDDNEAANLALDFERLHLSKLSERLDKFQQSRTETLTECFGRTLALKLLSDLTGFEGALAVRQIDDLISRLESAKTLLDLSLLDQTMSWETASTNIGEVWGDFLSYTLKKAMSEQAYFLIGSFKNRITGFIKGFEFLQGYTSCVNMVEMNNQLEDQLTKYLARVEDDLIDRQKKETDLEEFFQLKIKVNKTSFRTKQYSEVVSYLITTLQTLKGVVLTNPDSLQKFKEELSLSINRISSTFLSRKTTKLPYYYREVI